MNPKQIVRVPGDRLATAPYNFVAPPETVVYAEDLPDGSTYHSEPERYTGTIACTLTTASPLYTRCGWTLKDYAEFGTKRSSELSATERKARAPFFQYPLTPWPVIPGSSLRGMLRSLVGIVGYGKMQPVSGHQRFFFRAVADETKDPLQAVYGDAMKNVRAGYLVCEGDQWKIRPARTIQGATFAWVAERDVQGKVRDFIPMSDRAYLPQCHTDVAFGRLERKKGKLLATGIGQTGYLGTLVTSGNMLETSSGDWAQELQRKYHCIVFDAAASADLLDIEPAAIEDYRAALTPFQQQRPPFDERNGMLMHGRPVFYCVPTPGSFVTRFGHSPNFRIAYSWTTPGSAATAADFVPEIARPNDKPDLAEAIFGFVRGSAGSRAGRVFVSDAICAQTLSEVTALSGGSMVPRILASPKPTAFQHYLVQQDAERKALKHWGSHPGEGGGTIIRGFKLFWHQGDIRLNEAAADPDQVRDAPTQYTEIMPVKTGTPFDFKIRFENLSMVELGALLWVLDVAGSGGYRLSLGMGKPLGMGALSIKHALYLTDRKSRYTKLFANVTPTSAQWQTGESAADGKREGEFRREFEGYILRGIGKTDTNLRLKNEERIFQLLTMLAWPGRTRETTRSMAIEADEYKDRKVLPTPLQIEVDALVARIAAMSNDEAKGNIGQYYDRWRALRAVDGDIAHVYASDLARAVSGKCRAIMTSQSTTQDFERKATKWMAELQSFLDGDL